MITRFRYNHLNIKSIGFGHTIDTILSTEKQFVEYRKTCLQGERAPALCGSPKLWNTLRRLHTVDKPYKRRSFFISRFVTITTFFQWLQRVFYGRRARKISFENNPPIFILGHWRSGTTHLHYAFSRDPRLGYLSNFQTFLYTVALLSKTWLRPVVSRFMPETRPQDNVKVDADAPAEEEQPLSMVSLCTGIHSFFFGRETSYFEKYTLFQRNKRRRKGRMAGRLQPRATANCIIQWYQ